MRLGVFCGLGYGAARLIAREARLIAAVSERDHELAELRGIRAALTPAELPDRPALSLASCFVPSEQVGGDFYIVAAGPVDDGVEIDSVRPSPPLGVDIELGCEVAHSRLADGAGLLLFSDGLSEARRAHQARVNGESNGAPFGRAGIEQALIRLRGQDPETVVRALSDAAHEFAGGTLADDLCLVAIRARAPDQPEITSAPSSRCSPVVDVNITG